MQTVESIIKSVYDTDVLAAERLKVVRTAVSNWKTSGCFPTRLLAEICQHARERNVPLDVSEIPTVANKDRAADEAAA